MTTTTARTSAVAPRRFPSRFLRSDSGIAAVEFGLIVPIMLTMFIGTVELSQAITVDRRVTQVASSTADLVARQKTLTTATVDGYMSLITQIMAPYSATPMKITVTNVYATTAEPDVNKVCWSYNHNGGANPGMNTGGTFVGTLPTGILQGGTSVVVVEVSYIYAPTLLFNGTVGQIGQSFVGTGYTLTEKFYLKPRVSSSIQWNGAAACV